MVPTESEIVRLFSRFGLTQVYHIIIPHSTKIPKMSHVIRSLRPYVDALFLVKGMEFGCHYHGICHFKPKITLPTFTKFHLKRKPLIGVTQNTFTLDDAQNAEKAKYYDSLRKENNFFTLIPEEAQYVCASISCMITTYFTAKQRAEKAKSTKTKKDFHISSVYAYLIKNLNENTTKTEYQEYQLINLFQKKNKRSNILTNGIPIPTNAPPIRP